MAQSGGAPAAPTDAPSFAVDLPEQLPGPPGRAVVSTATVVVRSDDIAAAKEQAAATVEAAGGSMADVTQVLVYLPDPADFPGMNEAYARAFQPPYPNRATIVANLMVPGARIEVVAYAHIGRRTAARAATVRPKAKKRAASKQPRKRAGRRR